MIPAFKVLITYSLFTYNIMIDFSKYQVIGILCLSYKKYFQKY